MPPASPRLIGLAFHRALAITEFMQEKPTQVPLWRQLQGAASILMAVRDGQSMTAALADVDAALRPGVQALSFHALRWLGRAEALRQQLAKKPPPPEADALLCVALALIWREEDKTPTLVASRTAPPPEGTNFPGGGLSENFIAPYTEYTLVDQAVEAAKRSEATTHQASFINGCLRRFLRERDALVAKTDANPQAVWNHPQWWIDRLRKDHPQAWQAILRANNQRASLILRINERKTTPAHYLSALAAMNIVAKLVGRHGVVLASAQAVPLLPGFADGLFSVQDAAAQLAAPLLLAPTLATACAALPPEGAAAPAVWQSQSRGPCLNGEPRPAFGPAEMLPLRSSTSRKSLPPEGADLAWGGPALRPVRSSEEVRPVGGARLKVLDACAAPGGKTAHLLELADCDVTALDIDARRCERIAQNLERLGLKANIVVGDASRPADWWDGQLFDAILLDAPCTASGIVRRHPDVRWLRRPTDIPQLAEIQARLLATLWPLLKPGGRLLYCTCSVFRAEGEAQAQTFVAHHTDALLQPSPGHLIPQSGVEATALPDNLNSEHDGFYYALLEKKTS